MTVGLHWITLYENAVQNFVESTIFHWILAAVFILLDSYCNFSFIRSALPHLFCRLVNFYPVCLVFGRFKPFCWCNSSDKRCYTCSAVKNAFLILLIFAIFTVYYIVFFTVYCEKLFTTRKAYWINFAVFNFLLFMMFWSYLKTIFTTSSFTQNTFFKMFANVSGIQVEELKQMPVETIGSILKR